MFLESNHPDVKSIGEYLRGLLFLFVIFLIIFFVILLLILFLILLFILFLIFLLLLFVIVFFILWVFFNFLFLVLLFAKGNILGFLIPFITKEDSMSMRDNQRGTGLHQEERIWWRSGTILAGCSFFKISSFLTSVPLPRVINLPLIGAKGVKYGSSMRDYWRDFREHQDGRVWCRFGTILVVLVQIIAFRQIPCKFTRKPCHTEILVETVTSVGRNATNDKDKEKKIKPGREGMSLAAWLEYHPVFYQVYTLTHLCCCSYSCCK